MSVESAVPTVYWMPGCSSCLRLKEFVEGTGVAFEAVNIDADPERRAEVEKAGVWPPAIAVDGRFANGLNLDEVAGLLGVEYLVTPPLPPQELYDRYLAIQKVYHQVLGLMPEGFLDVNLPGRERPMLGVADQVSSVMRSFLASYETGKHDVSYYSTAPHVKTVADLEERADETLELFTTWWEEEGREDPLDNVVSTYWGHHTLHEILEREVWHTLQHLRQLVYVLDEMGVEHDIDLDPLRADLPMPERIHD